MFWISPRLIPTTEDVLARSKRDRHSFHNDSFLNCLIEVQIIQQGQKRNTGRTHSPNSAHRKIEKLDFTVREREVVNQRAIFGSFTITIVLYVSFETYCKLKYIKYIFICK